MKIGQVSTLFGSLISLARETTISLAYYYYRKAVRFSKPEEGCSASMNSSFASQDSVSTPAVRFSKPTGSVSMDTSASVDTFGAMNSKLSATTWLRRAGVRWRKVLDWLVLPGENDECPTVD